MTHSAADMQMSSRSEAFLRILENNTLVLDGAMGTMIQRLGLSEADFRIPGIGVPGPLAGCNDLLCLSAPDKIKAIHAEYLNAGADIIETNSFNANAISLADYGLSAMAREISFASARLAREAVEACGRRAWVAGSVGPTSKSLSMARGLGDSDSAIGWDVLEQAYFDQICGLVEGGVDILLVETVFDGLNAKAAAFAARRAMEQCGRSLPLMISVTLTESGRTLAGQSLEAFVATIAHANPVAVGLNCGFGPDMMMPYVEALQKFPFVISVHPNAGLPNEMGEYEETPEAMATALLPALRRGWLNIVGGCCGTTPLHIKEISRIVSAFRPRTIPRPEPTLVLAGLDALPVVPERNFIGVGERCNVAGSRKFLRIIKEGAEAVAVEIARSQVEAGALVVDVNMDDAMLDARSEMSSFLSLIGMEPDVARVPVMIDSSKWDVIVEALKRVQGRPVVNSISLKEGEATFLERARFINRMGAAMVVMAFDEEGQAATFERRIGVCKRAYDLLTREAGIPGQDIIFDPNILAVATGMDEHANYALDFLRATEWIKQNLPGAKVSGGVSNLSFSFRGNNFVREAMHAIFLMHAIERGMDMAIINPATVLPVNEIPENLREAIDDVLLNRRSDATDRLIAMAEVMKKTPTDAAAHSATDPNVALTPAQRLSDMVVRGLTDSIGETADLVWQELGSALAVIDGPLMDGMNRVGKLFGEGKMFLPQVVKSARTMKLAVDRLTPHIEAEKGGTASSVATMVIATVKGDVHDIGKNIVDVVMNCNGFRMVDLGVMVPGEKIVEAAIAEKADLVGLSGLITPSLEEMCRVAALMEERGMKIPLMIGGAGTSAVHTAVKIAPCYSGPVVHTRDAASMPPVAMRFIDPATRPEAEAELRRKQEEIRRAHAGRTPLMPLAEARSRRPAFDGSRRAPAPRCPGISDLRVSVSDLAEFVNWRAFFAAWNIDASLASVGEIVGCDHCRAQWLAALPVEKRMKGAEAMQLLKEARRMLSSIDEEVVVRIAILPAGSSGDDIVIFGDNDCRVTIPTLRQQHAADRDGDSRRLALADWVAPIKDGQPDDWVGLFAATVGSGIERRVAEARASGDDYESLMLQSVADRLVEAATEWTHRLVRRELWGYSPDEPDNPGNLLRQYYRGIRPAVGYPSLPDQSLVFELDRILHYGDIGVSLTENGALHPSSTTTGLILAHEDSRYFVVGRITDEQRRDYGMRRSLSPDDLARFLPEK